MCGIAGLFAKTAGVEEGLGLTITNMLSALGRRGPDSAGVALINSSATREWIVCVKAGDSLEMALPQIEENIKLITEFVQTSGLAQDFSVAGSYVRFTVPATSTPATLAGSLERLTSGIEVVSIGRALELFKEVGSPSHLEERHHVTDRRGTHCIGHTRLSTESKVDLSHSQPFWSHGTPDVAIVHNGHITNYHQLRRRYEQRGVHFYTENDSEILAIFVGERIREGASLREALGAVLREMDGSFCCLAVTEEEMGYVKDQYGFKPLVFAETPDFVAVATEEIAIRKAIPGHFAVREAQVEEVRVWRR